MGRDQQHGDPRPLQHRADLLAPISTAGDPAVVPGLEQALLFENGEVRPQAVLPHPIPCGCSRGTRSASACAPIVARAAGVARSTSASTQETTAAAMTSVELPVASIASPAVRRTLGSRSASDSVKARNPAERCPTIGPVIACRTSSGT